jgi:hypothetical protein
MSKSPRFFNAPTVAEEVHILYTNWQGEVGWRRIVPKEVIFASSSWHPEPQWVLTATDLDKNAERSFAIKDIHEWVVA